MHISTSTENYMRQRALGAFSALCEFFFQFLKIYGQKVLDFSDVFGFETPF